MTAFDNPEVKKKFDTYPDIIRKKLLSLRELIYEVANNEPSITKIEETLKWNEPAYLTNNGSTLRIDWKASRPEHYSIYVNCQTKLITTFKQLFNDNFTFEGKREILFHKDDKIDKKALRYCILLTLTYHDRKHLPMLDT